MFYRNELLFLCDVFKKSRVHTKVMSEDEFLMHVKPSDPTGNSESELLPLPEFPKLPESFTVCKLTDRYDLSYIYLLLPETDRPTILLIGPYLTADPSSERLLELGEARGISPSNQTRFEEYYTSIPLMCEGDRLFIMLSSFCERIWKKPSFPIVEVNNETPSTIPLIKSNGNDSSEDSFVSIKTIEQRYEFENDLLRAVTLGQLHKEDQLISAFSENFFEKRLSDPLRNAKNYGIIMNTLLRKAAENGGVHPMYIDRLSSEFAARIERMSDISENLALMLDIFRSYCRLVRKHTMTSFSIVVQKAILMIESDLSANLSLSTIAESQSVSAPYLSALFKKDTGKTVSEYIREKRVQLAQNLLSTTNLQVQTVALHCGFIDVQYFSKIFKKVTGMTPKQYRESSVKKHK